MAIFFDFAAFWNRIFDPGYRHLFSSKIVGFDYGTYKIGIAVSDDGRDFAFPKEVLLGKWTDLIHAVDTIFALCLRYNSNIVVIGLPKKNSGADSLNCKKVLEIANLLNFKFMDDRCAILLFDERFSTKSTISVFNTRKARNVKTRKKQKNNTYIADDAAAASIILGDVLRTKNILKK